MIPADLIVTNANLITLDARRPRARALAVYDGTIAHVGDDATAGRFGGPATRELDAGGRTIVPGFCDAHMHLFGYGRQILREVDLVGAASIDELLGRLCEHAGRSEGWIEGYGFDQDKLAERRFPTRADLDGVSRDRPVIISRICGHAAVVNSAALARVDESARAAGDGERGLYTEGDVSAFYRRIPPLDESEMEAAVLRAAQVALRTGITSVQTLLDTPDQMTAYSRLRARGALPIRVCGMPPYAAVAALHGHGVRSGLGDRWLRFGGAKLFSDGSLGAQTALLAEPYTDRPSTRGLRIYEPEDLKRKARDAQAKGFQLVIHAIGDQAVRETLDAIEFALCGASNDAHRHRVEHVSLCPPDCLERMAARRVVAVVQPQFVRSDSWTAARIGPARAPWAYPFASLLRAGVPLALSSDCPVERLDAFACLRDAVGGDPWRPGETVSAEEALRAYCLGGAYAGHAEAWSGSLEVGKVADFVVLSGDPTTLDAEAIGRLAAERVFVSGIEREPA
jgi:predicted amidohydrolase YtcJ